MGIEVSNLSFSYGKREVLHDVSFTVGDGEFAALLGPNGAGKTTLFRCVLGFLRTFGGSVRCGDLDVKEASPRLLSKHMAYIPQSAAPVFNHTVIDTVLMGAAANSSPLRMPSKPQVESAERALERLGITELRNRGCRTLSGGEAQLVLIARALAQGASALVMDEPSANLDLGNRRRVLSLARDLSRDGYTVLMSIHDPELALVFAGRAMMLFDGRIIADGEVGDVITEKLIFDVYGVSVRVSNSDGGKGILFLS